MGNLESITGSAAGLLKMLSDGIAEAVAKVAPSVVRVDDGSRLTASGLVWSEDGLIVTSSHGLERDDDLAIVDGDGNRTSATLLGRNEESDLALLRTEASGLARIDRAKGSEIRIGQIAIAIARPGDRGLQATFGLVGGILEADTDGKPEFIIRTDAVLYPGFSGGALATAEGKVAGIANRIFGRGAGVALGIEIVEQTVAAILAEGTHSRGYLGVRTQLAAIPGPLQSSLGINQRHGLLIIQVEPGSPADTAGLLFGDLIIALDDKPLEDVGDLRRQLKAGRRLNLSLVRAGSGIEVAITLGALG